MFTQTNANRNELQQQRETVVTSSKNRDSTNSSWKNAATSQTTLYNPHWCLAN